LLLVENFNDKKIFGSKDFLKSLLQKFCVTKVQTKKLRSELFLEHTGTSAGTATVA
jgi:hypothetical protein